MNQALGAVPRCAGDAGRGAGRRGRALHRLGAAQALGLRAVGDRRQRPEGLHQAEASGRHAC